MNASERHTPESSLPEFRNKPKYPWVTLSICLLLAVTLWFIVALSKIQQVTLHYPVSFVDAPPEISMLLRKQESLEMQVRANGFNLLMNYMLKPLDTMRISLKEEREINFYLPNKRLKYISQLLPYTLEAIDIKPDTLFLIMKVKGKKRVPVKSRINLQFANSWLPVSKLKIEPDSVTLLGDPAVIKPIKSWSTQEVSFQDITNGIHEIVQMDTSHQIIIQPAAVRVHIQGDEFTQSSRTIPVRIINVPGKKKIRLNPDKITLSFLVPMSRFEEINDESFGVEIDYNKIRSKQQFVVPQLKHKPDWVRNIHIQPERIGFVITSGKQ